MFRIIPKHIAIIMDGNGRWAKLHRKPRLIGHQAGLKAAKTTIQFAAESGIPVLSLFAFSSENWSRPAAEVNALMELFVYAIEKEVEELHHHQIKLSFIGELSRFPPKLVQKIQQAQALTKENTGLHCQIAVNYGGRWDILQACKRIMRQTQTGEINPNHLTETDFAQYLMTTGVPDPDLLIRTSGELRISNFFLWQTAYTEFYFTNCYWPDFDETQFKNALAHFQMRERRYGLSLSQEQEIET